VKEKSYEGAVKNKDGAVAIYMDGEPTAERAEKALAKLWEEVNNPQTLKRCDACEATCTEVLVIRVPKIARLEVGKESIRLCFFCFRQHTVAAEERPPKKRKNVSVANTGEVVH
jgi:hypothetical protein